MRSIARSHKVPAIQIQKKREKQNKMVEVTKTKKALFKEQVSRINYLEDRVFIWGPHFKNDDLAFGYKHIRVQAY